MRILWQIFSTRAIRVHLVFFAGLTIAFVALDPARGVDPESTFLGLDRTHIIALIWSLIFATLAIMTWFGGEVDDLDDETMRRGHSWLGHCSE